MENVLDIQDLNKYYDDFYLDDVSFSLPQGYIMGLIGPQWCRQNNYHQTHNESDNEKQRRD